MILWYKEPLISTDASTFSVENLLYLLRHAIFVVSLLERNKKIGEHYGSFDFENNLA